jgi:hypothetical protein
MTAVARSLKVSLVYYRDVELARRRPFSALKVNFDALARLLQADLNLLMHLAAIERGQLEFNFLAANDAERHIVLAMAQTLTKKRMSKARLRQIARILSDAG